MFKNAIYEQKKEETVDSASCPENPKVFMDI